MPGGRHVLLDAQLLSAPAVTLGPRPQFPWPSRQTAHSRSQSWGQDRSRGEKPLPCFHPHGWLDREKRSHLPRSQGSPSQLGEQTWSHKAPPDFLASERRWVDSCFPCKACPPDTVCKGRIPGEIRPTPSLPGTAKHWDQGRLGPSHTPWPGTTETSVHSMLSPFSGPELPDGGANGFYLTLSPCPGGGGTPTVTPPACAHGRHDELIAALFSAASPEVHAKQRRATCPLGQSLKPGHKSFATCCGLNVGPSTCHARVELSL